MGAKSLTMLNRSCKKMHTPLFVMCIQKSNVGVFDPVESSPCGMVWCVLCRKVLYSTRQDVRAKQSNVIDEYI